MEEQQRKDNGNKKQILQQITVPFLWEDKPGIAKKEWAPDSLSAAPQLQMITSPPPPPPLPPPSPTPGALLPSRPPPPPPPVGAKLVVSVPFKWEEKPGTPIRTFAKDPSLAAAKNKSLPLPPAYYSQFYECFESDPESSFEDDDDDEDDDVDDPDWLMELDQDVGSKSSAPSLLANRIIPASAIASAIPFGSSYQHTEQAPSSPDSGSSSTSSYTTGNTTSPVGNSFLEQLFPLYTTKADSPDKFRCTDLEKSGLHEAAEPKIKGLREADERSIVTRRPPHTLGELIMLSRRRSYLQKASRRRSYLQKAVMTRKNSALKEFEDPNANECCSMFGLGNGGIAKLLGWKKSLLTLK